MSWLLKLVCLFVVQLTSLLDSTVLSLNSGFTCRDTKQSVTSTLKSLGIKLSLALPITQIQSIQLQRWMIVAISMGTLPPTAHVWKSQTSDFLMSLLNKYSQCEKKRLRQHDLKRVSQHYGVKCSKRQVEQWMEEIRILTKAEEWILPQLRGNSQLPDVWSGRDCSTGRLRLCRGHSAQPDTDTE